MWIVFKSLLLFVDMCFNIFAFTTTRQRRGTTAGQNERRPIKAFFGRRPEGKRRVVDTPMNYANLIPIVHSSKPSLQHAVFATLNACSVRNRIDQIKHTVNEENIDILALTETSFNSNSSYKVSDLLPVGYSILCEDRIDERGGGVVVLCSSSLNPKTSKYHIILHLNAALFQLLSAPSSLRVVVIYRPPQTSVAEFIEQFNSLLDETCLGGSLFILAGDINIHMDNKDQTLTLKYNELLMHLVLHIMLKSPLLYGDTYLIT